MQHLRCIQLQIIIRSAVDSRNPFLFPASVRISGQYLFYNDLPLDRKVGQKVLHRLQGDAKKLRSAAHQLRLRQINVTLRHRLRQHIQNPAFYTKIRVGMNTHSGCDFIGNPKADAVYVIRQLIGVFPHDLIKRRPVLIVDFHGKRRGNTVLLQKKHRLTHIALFLHLLCDFPRLALADALDLREPLRFLLNDAEGIALKTAHDPRGECHPDTLHRSRAKVTLNGKLVLRRFIFIRGYLKLPAIGTVLRIAAFRLDQLPLAGKLQRPDTGYLLSLADQDQHRIAIVLIAVYDMIHIS